MECLIFALGVLIGVIVGRLPRATPSRNPPREAVLATIRSLASQLGKDEAYAISCELRLQKEDYSEGEDEGGSPPEPFQYPGVRESHWGNG